MKIALVHDYLLDFGGAERVLLELHRLYPKAPIYTILVNKRGMGKFWQEFKGAKVEKSWFHYLPFSSKLISPLRFLLPAIWKSFDLTSYDVIIDSASWAVTKGFAKKKGAVEICYLHSPPRYLYGFDTSRNWKNKWFSKLVWAYSLVVNHFMRMYDFESAQKVNYFVANSKNTGKRIEKYYRRYDYKVIYPPVDTSSMQHVLSSKPSYQLPATSYFLAGGRMVASKNFDLTINACKRAGVKLKIFGDGIEENNLRKLATTGVEFLGKVSDEELVSYYKDAMAFILAQKDEDFGMTSVEAMAAGCPVIAYRGGGYEETVVENKTGIFFNELTVEALAKAIKNFNDLNHRSITPEACIKQAKNFSKERFVKEIKAFVASRM